MQTQLLSSASAAPFAPARFTPPAHVHRWTGRAVPTIFLPNLASLRLDAAARAAHAGASDRTRN